MVFSAYQKFIIYILALANITVDALQVKVVASDAPPPDEAPLAKRSNLAPPPPPLIQSRLRDAAVRGDVRAVKKFNQNPSDYLRYKILEGSVKKMLQNADQAVRPYQVIFTRARGPLHASESGTRPFTVSSPPPFTVKVANLDGSDADCDPALRGLLQNEVARHSVPIVQSMTFRKNLSGGYDCGVPDFIYDGIYL